MLLVVCFELETGFLFIHCRIQSLGGGVAATKDCGFSQSWEEGEGVQVASTSTVEIYFRKW